MQSGLGQFLRSAKLARLYALADQGAQGLANLVAISVLGRHLPTGQFGAVGMAMGLYYVVAGFHRSAVILPYITEHGSDDRAYHSDWWWLNVLFGAGLTAILLGLAGGLALGTEWWPQAIWGVMPLALGALMTLPLLCAEHLRRWLYKRERADLVALVSGIYAVALVGAAWMLPQWRGDALGGALAWALAGSVATLLPLVWLRPAWPDWPASWNCLARHRRFASWLALTIVPYMVYSSATVVVFIGLFNGPLAAAVFTAGRTLTNPAISMVSAVDSIDKPRAARAFAEQGLVGLRRSVRQTRWLLGAGTGGFLAGVALFAEPLLELAFHGAYRGIEPEVRWLALAFFLFCLNQPSETLLIVMRASATMFVTRSVTALVTLGLLVAGAPYGVSGMAIGLALAQGVNLLALLVAERWVAGRQGMVAA
jgi:O-antigen/teichoic acid export membrane protein